MFYCTVPRGQPFTGFFRLVIERSDSAAIGDASALINDVNPLGPGSVRIVGGVAHIVDAEGQGEFESLDEIVGDHDALLQRFWLGVADFILQIGFHLPFVGGVRFANVDGQEIRVLFVIVVNLNDVANLAAKGWSSKTAKHQNQGPAAAGTFANMKTAGAIERHDPRVWRIAAHFQRAAMHVRQRVAHHAVGVLWTPRQDGQPDERSHEQHAKKSRRPFPEAIHAHLLQLINLDTLPRNIHLLFDSSEKQIPRYARDDRH